MMRLFSRNSYLFSKIPSWATVDPWTLSKDKPHTISNILDGQVKKSSKTEPIVDPLNGGNFIYNSLPENKQELDAYVTSQRKVPHHGVHNPIKNVHRFM